MAKENAVKKRNRTILNALTLLSLENIIKDCENEN